MTELAFEMVKTSPLTLSVPPEATTRVTPSYAAVPASGEYLTLMLRKLVSARLSKVICEGKFIPGSVVNSIEQVMVPPLGAGRYCTTTLSCRETNDFRTQSPRPSCQFTEISPVSKL